MRPQNEKKKIVPITKKKKKEAPVSADIQWTKKVIEDASGTAMECIILSWTDLAILTASSILGMPVFMSYIRDREDNCYAIFADISNKNSEQFYAVSIGNVKDIIDSYVKSDNIVINNLFTKLKPKVKKED